MNDNMYYLYRMPKKSEFNLSNYLVAILVFVLMMIIYVYKYYPDIWSLLLFIIVFFYIGIAATAKSMKTILIKKIESTIIENIEISQKHPHFGFYLLAKPSTTNSFYKSEIRFFWVGIALLFILFGVAAILNIQQVLTTYYIPYIYLSIWISLFTLKRLDDVFKYFQDINKNLREKTCERKGGISLPPQFENHINYFQLNQWQKIKKISLIICVIFVMIVSLIAKFDPFSFLLIIFFSGLIFLWINMRFLNRQLNAYLPILRKYDDFIKSEIGLSYHPEKDDKGYSEFADELNKDIKDIFH